jgi:DNA repair protein SbcC/Rad50
MEILSVTLTNFKAHSDKCFAFQPGTNAICGENGAGKTSILEAIAWVLFDHKGDYKVEELIRNGSASAQVEVLMISSRDQRTYRVKRCTRSGYSIHDPQTGENLGYTRIKDEVLPWLRQHLGLAPGTDLADLFSSTIGVPQGMFTADFLLEASKRKAVFDKVLKVEEYQKTWKELATLEKYSKVESERMTREIEQHEEALQDQALLKQKRSNLTTEITALEGSLEHWQAQLKRLQQEQQYFSQQIQAQQNLKTQIDRAQFQSQSQQKRLVEIEQELTIAQQAFEICTTRRSAYGGFQEAEKQLQALEQQRSQQQQLFQQKQTLIQNTSAQQSKLAVLAEKLDRLAQSAIELDRLKPEITKQEQIEQRDRHFREQLQTFHTWRQTIQRDEKRLQQLKVRQIQLQKEMAHLDSLAAAVQALPELEDQQQRYQQQLSRITAARQFEADLRQIFTNAQSRGQVQGSALQAATALLTELATQLPLQQPALTKIQSTLAESKNLQSDLLASLETILNDLSTQLEPDRIQQNLTQVQTKIRTVRQQQAQFLTREAKAQEAQTIATEIVEVRNHLTEIQKNLSEEPAIQQQLSEVLIELRELNDPRGRSRLLAQDLQERSRIVQQQQAIQSTLTTTNNTLIQIDRDLEKFADLADSITEQQALKASYQVDYELYLKHREIANRRNPLQVQFDEIKTQLETLEETLEALQVQWKTFSTELDPQAIAALTTALTEAQTQQTTIATQLPMKQQLLNEYNLQATKLDAIQTKLTTVTSKLKQHQRTDRFIKFARKAFKEAGPRITERYVQTIAYEADKLFRELLNRPNIALDWTRDYEIRVREGANDRRFVNLSGGEQMCAALAVRLALLKVLADLNVAFFDEPTTNMDRPRRVKLAEAIANIKTFRQLFVISHDDTFEQVTENVIMVTRE